MTAAAPPEDLRARYDGLICAALALMLDGRDPTPILGEGDTAEAAVALFPVWSCLQAAVTAVAAASAVEPDADAEPDDNVLEVDRARINAAVRALNRRAIRAAMRENDGLTE